MSGSGPTISTFGLLTSAAEIAAAFPNAIQGKNIIVTGVSPNSLGLATADAFASRSPASQDDSIPTIDILVNNAGVMAIPTLTLSEDGIETTFATNHLGHFLFTNLILPKIIKAAQTSSTPTRIINVTSFGHQFSPVRFSDINFSKCHADLPADERPDLEKTEFFTGSSHAEDTYYGFFSYAQSKTANILFSIARTRDYPVGTNINRHATPSEIEQALKRAAELGFGAAPKTPGQRANSSVLAAVDPGLSPVDAAGDEVKGAYIADCRVDDENFAGFAQNGHFAERLWALSEGLAQQKFEV